MFLCFLRKKNRKEEIKIGLNNVNNKLISDIKCFFESLIIAKRFLELSKETTIHISDFPNDVISIRVLKQNKSKLNQLLLDMKIEKNIATMTFTISQEIEEVFVAFSSMRIKNLKYKVLGKRIVIKILNPRKKDISDLYFYFENLFV